jgi:opacity protein-like surface antigen
MTITCRGVTKASWRRGYSCRMTRQQAVHGILIFLASCAFNQPARADGIGGLYLGGSAGIAKIATDNSAFQTLLQTQVEGLGVLEFTSASLHDRKTAWWANAGYMVWPYVGVDLSYLHMGELYNQVNGTFTSHDGTPSSVGAATRLSSKGPALGLLFQLPLTENLDVNLRVADYYARTTLTNILNGTSYLTMVQSANRSSFLAGFGVSYVFAGHWSARLDYLRIEDAGDSTTGKYTAAILTAGASYNF